MPPDLETTEYQIYFQYSGGGDLSGPHFGQAGNCEEGQESGGGAELEWEHAGECCG